MSKPLNDCDLGSSAHLLFEKCVKAKFKSPHEFVGRNLRLTDDGQHSTLSPSGAHRWVLCPGSVEIGEPSEPRDWRFVVDEAMADAVEVAVDFCRNTVDDLLPLGDVQVGSEAYLRLPFLDFNGPGGGSVDFWCGNTEAVHVADYKHGQGVPVEAIDNYQMMLYLYGILQSKFKNRWSNNLYVHIIQPRCSHAEGPIRSWNVSHKRLREFIKEVEQAVAAIKSGKANCNPGPSQCKWCRKKATCRAVAEKVCDVAKADFETFMEGKPAKKQPSQKEPTPKQLAQAMSWVDFVRDWAKAVEAKVFALVNAGDPVVCAHYKLVHGKSNRRWKDEEAVKTALSAMGVDPDAFMPRSLLGLGAIEKLVPKANREQFMVSYTEKPEGKPVLAEIADPRPSITAAEYDFQDHIEPQDS